MLDPTNRAIYHDVLKPVDGFEIDFAMATTYSLDLAALLFASISLSGFNYTASDDILDDPISLLKSLQDMKDRLVVFCQHDRLTNTKDNLLFGFLGETVIPIDPGDCSFHPKIWIVRMTKGDEVRYRFGCLSRNLTFDRSWDIAIFLDGQIGEKVAHPDLEKIVKDLQEMGKDSITDKIRTKMKLVQQELPRVVFDPPDGFYDDINFTYCYPGVPFISKLRGMFNRILVISPFISDDMLRKLKAKVYNPRNDFFLISRLEKLNEIRKETDAVKKESALNDVSEIRYFKSEIESEADQDSNSLQGLHAKVVLVQKGYDVFLYAGSANATNSGMNGRNYEFMVRLSCKGREYYPQNVVEDSYLTEMTSRYVLSFPIPVDTGLDKELDSELDNMRKNIIRRCEAIEVKIEGDKYNLVLRLKNAEKAIFNGNIYCWPLGVTETQAVLLNDKLAVVSVALGSIDKSRITSFLNISCKMTLKSITKQIKFVVKLPVIGEPSDKGSALLNYIISDKERFLQYILMLMGEFTNINEFKKKGQIPGATGSATGDIGGFFANLSSEDMLRCFAEYPDRFKKIQNFISVFRKNELSARAIPEDFLSVWEVFEKAAEGKK